MVGFQRAGKAVFDYGNNIRGEAQGAGYENAFAFPGFVPAYIRPLFCEGYGPFRWIALSGEPRDITATDDLVLELFPEGKSSRAGSRSRASAIPGAAGASAGSSTESACAWRRLNDLVARGKVTAPIVIGRDHLDSGSVASPYRETEAMRDGSDAVADWPILNALLNAVNGAAWVSVHHGGGVGMGLSIHAGLAVLVDGTKEGAAKIERCLTGDLAWGQSHADAGYPGHRCARRDGIRIRC
jgi:urocanate hydratase